MKLTIPDFSAARILVAGDVMLDRYWQGPSDRISPEAPVPVVRVETREDRPGGAANVALNIASLGADVRVLGLTGTDPAADELAYALSRRGVETDLIGIARHATVTKLRVLSRHQQLLRLDFEDGFPNDAGFELYQRLRTRIDAADLLVLSDYGKGALSRVQDCIQIARQAGKPVLIDPKGRDFQRYRGASLITPNLSEFQAVMGECADDAAIERKGFDVIQNLSLDALLITRGEHGMTLLRGKDEVLHLPVQAREVFDVTGAGDTVIAVLAVALATGQSLTAATALANQAAGLVVAKLGTASVSYDELQQSLQASHTAAIVDEAQLVDVINQARQRGETLVMTNGCFDILHAGHVHYLEQASRLGDRLIVAVNDDATVQKLKGPARPVNTLQNRLRMLAALAAVDWVVPFYEDTPERLICRIKPDFLVKGGDNDPARIPGNHCVWDAGGEVVVLDYIDDVSTTGIIRRIRAQ